MKKKGHLVPLPSWFAGSRNEQTAFKWNYFQCVEDSRQLSLYTYNRNRTRIVVDLVVDMAAPGSSAPGGEGMLESLKL